jgi:hypothetical protein
MYVIWAKTQRVQMHAICCISNYIWQSSWEASSRSANQEILYHLRKPEFHRCVHKRPSLLPVYINHLCNISWHAVFFLRWGVFSPHANPQPGGPLLVGSPLLHIQYIHSYSVCLEAVSTIRNLRTRHSMLAGTHFTCIQAILISYMLKLCFSVNLQRISITYIAILLGGVMILSRLEYCYD